VETIGISKVLATGYTALEYIESTGTQYIDTGIDQGSASTYQTDIIYEYTSSDFSSASICGNFATYTSSWGQPFGGDGKIWCGYPNTGYCDVSLGVGVKYYDSFKIDVVNGTITRTFNGNTSSDSGITFTPPAGKCALFGCFINDSTSVGQRAKIKCYGFKIYKDDVLVLNFIPARETSTGDIGMYDTVSQTFFTNAGTGTFVAGPEAYHSTATCEDLLSIGDYTDIQEVIAGDVTRKVGVKVLDGTEFFNESAVDDYRWDSSSYATKAPVTDVLCSHMPYSQTPIEGPFIRGMSSENISFRNMPSAGVGITNVTTFKQWLADQYAAGTPVIIVYPLATATTESVAGQTLQVQQGDNTLEITQASLDNLELECKYKKSA